MRLTAASLDMCLTTVLVAGCGGGGDGRGGSAGGVGGFDLADPEVRLNAVLELRLLACSIPSADGSRSW